MAYTKNPHLSLTEATMELIFGFFIVAILMVFEMLGIVNHQNKQIEDLYVRLDRIRSLARTYDQLGK